MKGSRYLILHNFTRLPEHRTLDFLAADKAARKTATAYLQKEIFRSF